MEKDIAIITLHGMGKNKKDYANGIREELADDLGKESWAQIHFESIFYQDILQPNQDRVMKEMKKDEIDWITLREFLLFGFSDAAGLERNAGEKNSPYKQAQEKIFNALDRSFSALGSKFKPVVIVAQSLGCQVISNYIWDSQKVKANTGVWKDGQPDDEPKGSPKDRFRRLKSLRFLFSTGCNIPVFVAGFSKDQIKAISTSGKGYNFSWHNFYDRDDALGWPLKPLSPSYKKAIFEDREINAGGGFFKSIVTGWNPFSHGNYWEDGDFIKPLSKKINSLL
ncbi:hypothetical protein [Candidatus Nitronereus thalassa]|uniref:Alpha/beta hydrolase family protein n=1 Tax=Candidatus Nitronereus thalassa TaxID=3020898 RepID=A0ABU3KCZ5_9BACT|nr:hypothetical protein [Candidatus Nitronereus thalassa]MDT7044302.1 hypothetical protein [Candidatus Nitronereus thalassa]